MLSHFFGVKKEPPKQTVFKFDQRLLESTKQTPALNDQLLLDLLLTKISHQLSENLGDDNEAHKLLSQLRQHTAEYMSKLQNQKVEQIQRNLVETKNKHFELIEIINSNNSKTRQFHDSVYNCIENMVIVIGEMLQSKEFEPHLKNIKKSIHDMSIQAFQRNMTMMSNIYGHEHGKFIQHALSSAKSPIKQLEQELHSLRDLKNKNAKQIKQLQNSKKQLTDKLKLSQESLKLSEQLLGHLNKEKSYNIEKDYASKLRLSEERVAQLKEQCKQHQNSISSLQTKISSLQKIIEQQKIENKIEFDNRQSSFNTNLIKMTQQKIHLEENLSQLQLELKKVKTEQALKVEEAVKQHLDSMDQLRDRADRFQKELIICKVERDELKTRKEGLVEKQVVRTMVQGFLEEGKDWAVRKEIQKRLFLLLGITKVDKEEPKKSGWFGLF